MNLSFFVVNLSTRFLVIVFSIPLILLSSADIKFSVEVIVSGSNTTNLCRIGVMDKCGNISRWTLQDDDVQLTSEIECPKKTKCFALLAPRGNQESTLHGKSIRFRNIQLFCYTRG